MKKNILIVRSLLILPLITPCLILSMESTEKSAPQSAIKKQPRDLFSELSWSIMGRRAILDEQYTIEGMGRRNEDGSIKTAPIDTPVTLTQTIYLEPINIELLPKKQTVIKPQEISTTTAETANPMLLVSDTGDQLDKLIAEALHEAELDILIAEVLADVQQTSDLMQMANEKKAFFKDVHSELLENKNKKLKPTPEIAQTTKSTPSEDWVKGYQIWIEKYQDTVKAIVDNKVTLKPTSIDTPDMTQSIVALPIPTKKGFEGQLYAASFIKQKQALIHDALISGMFDPHNETHVEYLEYALEFYVNENNIERLTAMLEICQHHLGKLDINEKTARKVHNFLENIAAKQEEETKQILEKKSTEFVATQNALIIALQEEVAKRTAELHDKLDQYGTDYNTTLAARAEYIRSLKKGTANVHGIKPQLKHAKNETCSDKIKCLSSAHNKVYITQADVDAVYTNKCLLNRVDPNELVSNLFDNTRDSLEHIDAIGRATKSVQLLTQ